MGFFRSRARRGGAEEEVARDVFVAGATGRKDETESRQGLRGEAPRIGGVVLRFGFAAEPGAQAGPGPDMGGQQANGGQQYYDADYKVVDDDDNK